MQKSLFDRNLVWPTSLENEIQVEKRKIKKFTDEQYLEKFLQFNKIIGLPKHVKTDEPTPLTSIQKTFFQTYCHQTRQNKIHLNKARQCGWTELVLRILAFNCFHKYMGRKIIIIPGTSQRTTKEIYGRFRRLFNNISEEILVDGFLNMKLKNGTEIHGLPASTEAITGWTRIAAVFMDEAAKWNLVDDQPVINSILPIVRSNESDLYMISTPKGPRGFFYSIENQKNTDFTKVVYDIHAGGQELYSNTERMQMINSSEEDPEQEYLNQYVAGRDSIFGSLDEDDYETFEEYQI